MVINDHEVLDELRDAKLHWDHQNYYEFGYSLGYALDQILEHQLSQNKLPDNWIEDAWRCPSENLQEFKLLAPHP